MTDEKNKISEKLYRNDINDAMVSHNSLCVSSTCVLYILSVLWIFVSFLIKFILVTTSASGVHLYDIGILCCAPTA